MVLYSKEKLFENAIYRLEKVDLINKTISWFIDITLKETR